MQPAALYHSAFYQFADIVDVQAAVHELRRLSTGLNGSVLVAAEGINGAVAGEAAALDAFEAALVTSPVFNGQLKGMAFKRSACTTAPFARMKVHHKPEIVAVGVPAQPVPSGSSLSPQAWRELIAQDDVVVLDNRNSFEFRLGRFKGAVDPQVASFRDFPKFIEANAPQWAADGKRVAMYCTGGIRCEKTSGWMQGLGLEVYQLEGGILNYFQAMPDAALDWQGECFVFDNRIALDTALNETPTTLEDVYQREPDGEWRMARARRLQAGVEPPGPVPPPQASRSD
ncbi:rhodanese-related sulfurtransferase [soil metagenome]